MWIAMNPENPRHRTVFGTQEEAAGFARQLSPHWQVRSVDDPDVAPITGRPAAASDQPAG